MYGFLENIRKIWANKMGRKDKGETDGFYIVMCRGCARLI
jgi:hypothetical protein